MQDSVTYGIFITEILHIHMLEKTMDLALIECIVLVEIALRDQMLLMYPFQTTRQYKLMYLWTPK